MLSIDWYRAGYGEYYDMLKLSLFLWAYCRTITQCTQNDKSTGDQPSMIICLLLLDYHSFQTWRSQVFLLVKRFWHHNNTDFKIIMGTMIRIVSLLCPPLPEAILAMPVAVIAKTPANTPYLTSLLGRIGLMLNTYLTLYSFPLIQAPLYIQ